MSDNPQPWFALPGHAVIALEGRDAAAFAQAQFMNDASPLAVGQWQWSGWLTPKGRVIALFALLRHGEEAVWLLLPDAEPEAFAAELQRYVFRSKVAIAVRGELRASGAFRAPVQARGNAVATTDGGMELDFGAEDGARTLRIAEAPAAGEDAVAALRWKAFDLAHGLPRLAAAQAGQWTPQQLSLERLHAFSVKKGCYPGQEIVARTHFLGQAKRGLVLLEGDVTLADGDEVRIGERVAGTIVSVAGQLALAVLPLEREPDIALTVASAEVRERPLQTGLAR
jgi:folate-binding protein YgfZ